MKAVLVISDHDNVATALVELEPGRLVTANGRSVTVVQPVPPGHKLAIRLIAVGEAVIKYGSPIGTATSDIPVGAHVHTHNLQSSRGRGDLSASHPLASAPGARLAEPPDERTVPGANGRGPLAPAGGRHE